MTSLTSITVVVVTYRSSLFVKPCLQALLDCSHPFSELIVVDNASTDNTVEIVESNFPSVQLVRSDRNLGFAGGVNLGLTRASGELVAIVNPDVVLQPDWLAEMVKVFESEPRVGIAGGKLLYPDGRTIQHAGGMLKYPLALADHHGYRELDVGRYDRLREVDYVTGAAVVARRDLLESLGGLDEEFYPAYFEETDLCRRIRHSGFRVLYVPTAVGIHHESASTVRDSYDYYRFYHRNRLRFVLKHYTTDQFQRDFLPAEMSRLESIQPIEEKKALLEVYQEAGDKLPSGDMSASSNRDAIVEDLGRLRRRAAELFGECGERRELLRARLGRVGESSQVSERPFVSNAPIVGRAIVRFREAWNWVSTKWYVAQLLQQQNRVNAELVDLNARIIEYTSELEEKVVELHRYVGQVENMAIEVDRKSVELTRDLAGMSAQIRRTNDQPESELVGSEHRPE